MRYDPNYFSVAPASHSGTIVSALMFGGLDVSYDRVPQSERFAVFCRQLVAEFGDKAADVAQRQIQKAQSGDVLRVWEAIKLRLDEQADHLK